MSYKSLKGSQYMVTLKIKAQFIPRTLKLDFVLSNTKTNLNVFCVSFTFYYEKISNFFLIFITREFKGDILTENKLKKFSS